jgi:hypothetical protein
MADEPLPAPPRAPVSAEFLAENARKQAAYAAVRRGHYERLARAARGDEEESDTPGAAPGKPRGRIPDRRQLGLEV